MKYSQSIAKTKVNSDKCIHQKKKKKSLHNIYRYQTAMLYTQYKVILIIS